MPTTVLERSPSQRGETDTLLSIAGGSYDAAAQAAWAALPIKARISILKKTRHLLASRTQALCDAIPSTLARNPADTRAAEILPLLAACKFLEQEAASILKPRRLGGKGRPFWLAGVTSKVQRAPMGRILVIAPSNYPLFLPGVQVLQALAAGNAVVWKPGTGGREIALLFAETVYEAGLPRELLKVTDESIEAAKTAITRGVDKVFFTGSASSGRALLRQLAETLTPCVAELSGCDAVFVLPSADLFLVVKALAFGMRLNGSATCMAPRRVVLVGADSARRKQFIGLLLNAVDRISGISLPVKVQRELPILIADAIQSGAHIHGELEASQQPLLVTGANAAMKIAQADIFAPVLTLLEARDTDEAVAVNEACPFALTASIFGEERAARRLAASLAVGTVLINDLIVGTADPRVPFGGRRQSGFGVTRGAEGLREMTTPKTVTIRGGSGVRHLEATTAAHEPLFDGAIQASHAGSWKQRLAGFKQMIVAASKTNKK